MEDLLTKMHNLFDGLEAQQLLPLDQVPSLSINIEELPNLQDWETGNAGGSPTPTKPAQPQTLELAQEVEEMPQKPICESKDEPECDLVIVLVLNQQPAAIKQEGEYAMVARQILHKDTNIAQHMME